MSAPVCVVLFAFALVLFANGAAIGADASYPVEGFPASLDSADCGGAHACAPYVDVANFLLQASAGRVNEQRGSAQIPAAFGGTAPDDSLEPPAPITLERPFQLHIPKTGSSFNNVLVHYVCGDSIPANVTVQQPDAFFDVFGEQCPRSKFGRFGKDAVAPIPPDVPLRTVVAMMREPRSRVLAGYEYFMVGCPPMQKMYNCHHWHQEKPCTGDVLVEGNWLRNASVIDPMEYATCVAETVVVGLVGDPRVILDGVLSGGLPEDVVEDAVGRVDELGFVGLTEEWNMSVCLFHAKFGGPILASEIYNVRPGVEKRVGDNPVAHALISEAEDRLKAWDAMPETRVYEAAVVRFWREVARYKVDRESCQRKIDDACLKMPTVAPPLQGHPITFRADAKGLDEA